MRPRPCSPARTSENLSPRRPTWRSCTCSFDAVVSKFASSHDAPKSSLEVFTLLCEEIVDHVADILEQLAGE
jgi:Mg2+ and Co2+ transporter CorA